MPRSNGGYPQAPFAWPHVGSQWPAYNIESDQGDGLVAWWAPVGSMGKAILRDYAGDELHGTFPAANSPTWTTDSEHGAAMDFVALTDYVTLPADARPTTAHTVAIWLNPDSWTNLDSVFGGRGLGSDADDAGIALVAWSPNLLYELYDTDDRVTCYISQTYAPVGAWTHLALMWDGTTGATAVRAYANGVQVASTSGADLADLAIAWGDYPLFRLGDNYRNGFDGRIGDFRIYNRALTVDEVKALYDPATRWELYQPPRRLWSLAPTAAPTDALPMAMDHYRRRRVV